MHQTAIFCLGYLGVPLVKSSKICLHLVNKSVVTRARKNIDKGNLIFFVFSCIRIHVMVDYLYTYILFSYIYIYITMYNIYVYYMHIFDHIICMCVYLLSLIPSFPLQNLLE